MGIRTGANAPLGCPAFDASHPATVDFPLGTVVSGYDSVADAHNEYIFLSSAAAKAVGDDVTYDANYATTGVAAGTGQADAIVAVGAGERAWFQLKPR